MHLKSTFIFPPLILLISNLYPIGTAGFEFLKLGIGEKSAFGAISGSLNQLFFNPAELSSISQPQISFLHYEGLIDTRYGFLGVGLPLKNNDVLACGVIYLSHGEIVGRSVSGHRTSNFTATDKAAIISYSLRTNKFSYGFNLKFFQEKISDFSANGYAVDWGISYIVNNLNLGLSIRNIGPKVKFIKEETYLPTELSCAVSYKSESIGVLLAGNLNYSLPERTSSFDFGVGYAIGGMILPWLNLSANGSSSRDIDFGFGVGFNYKKFQFNYKFSIFDELGSTHSIGVDIKL